MTRFVALAIALAASVAACTVGPDFVPPAAPTATGYTPPGEARATTADAGPEARAQAVALGAKVAADWWTLFRSPALDAVVKDAVSGSPTIESADARLAQARETVNAAAGALYPQVNFGASVTRQRLNTASFGLSASTFALPPNFNLYQVGPTASFDLDLFGGTRRQVEEQKALAEVQAHQLDAAYLAVTGNTVAQAIQIAALRAQLRAIDDILRIDRQNLELVRTERDAGAVADTDVVSAQSQLAADATLRPGPEQQLGVARHALAVLLGRSPAEWTPPDFDLAALTLPTPVPVSLPSELVHRRPDILAAEAQLHAASAQIGVATAELYPKITLSGTIGAAALDPGHLFNPASLVWSIAAGLAQPVFDGGTRLAERRAALAGFKASAADYKQTVLQAFGQVADLLNALSHDAELLAAQRRALDTASESVRLQRISYTRGGTGIINLLDAERLYQQARLGYVAAEAQRFQDTVQLMVATGGSWDRAATP